MKHTPADFVVAFDGSATYRIVVGGDLDPSYADRVAGMAITTAKSGDGKTLTTLCGTVRDQAELNGVLETLYLLHLSLVAVDCIEKAG